MFLRRYFDIHVGPKRDPSYRRIAREMGHAPETIVLVSDVAVELDAARGAGMQVRLASRPGNPPRPEGHDFPVATSFDDLIA